MDVDLGESGAMGHRMPKVVETAVAQIVEPEHRRFFLDEHDNNRPDETCTAGDHRSHGRNHTA